MTEQVSLLSMDDVDNLVLDFLQKNGPAIKRRWQNNHGDSSLGYEAFLAEVTPKVKNACITFVNSSTDFSVLNAYLFTTIISSSKKEIVQTSKKISFPICPACKFFDIEQILSPGDLLRCSRCEGQTHQNVSNTVYRLAKTFSVHYKKGYKCPDCTRFIPHPQDSLREILCPYLDCSYVGNIGQLETMRHPTVMRPVSVSSLDECVRDTKVSKKDNLTDSMTSDVELEIKEELLEHIAILKEIIESNMNSLEYTSHGFTRIHYMSMYESFQYMVETRPEEMISYLIHLNRGESLQNKIFQKYISILEKKMPFGFKKNGKVFKITSLLDESLCLFHGISDFDAVVSDKLEIKNNTQEYYSNGTSMTYHRPYYIGKLLDVQDLESGESILSNVKEYSFTKIVMSGTVPGTKVSVRHLRVPPHYQMGGMVYLNRIRRKIVDKAHMTIYGNKRPVRNSA